MKITKNLKKVIIILFCIFIGILLTGKLDIEIAENLLIPSGVGYDVEKSVNGNLIYKVPVSVHTYGSSTDSANQNGNVVYNGEGYTIGETRKNRDMILGKRFILGGERVFVISSEQAELGIHQIIDILYTNPDVNNLGIVTVCKGKSEDILKFKSKGFTNSSEYIEGLVENLRSNNFFSDDYKIVDVFVSEESEGRNLTLPYIELQEDNIKATGMAIFKKDKMIGKIDMKEASILNILTYNKVKGILSIQKDFKDYIDYKAKVKRSVKCTKKDGKYKFTINLDFNGEIVSNELYKDINSEISVGKQFEKDMSEKIEAMCNDFINKMKNQYKLDLLELGRVAAAKYGRGTGVDWDKVISDSEIEVKVKVNIEKLGRGDY